MLNLRTIGLATALLLGLSALGSAQLPSIPGGTLFDTSGEVTAYVEDIILAQMPQNVTGRTGDFREEQLVEGHTTFVTLDIEIEREENNWTLNVTGSVECNYNADMVGGYFLGIPLPTRVDRAGAECRYGSTVIATPDPYFDPNNLQVPVLINTGVTIPFTTPDGQQSYATEYTFTTITEDAFGQYNQERYYAYGTPVLHEWNHWDGTTKDFWLPLPIDKLRTMDVRDFQVLFEDDPRLKL